ncbi:hypothetical protein IMG5_105970 [Ichthyophthirius multifiliis]|uniref:Uncharacterized protein n=1 Tax=Ichthyophthirius multifiliis TaxID=5932 RepID=G0QT40_ICHMU|nr:hypothetical protein IMG5_105970 [Ichthyophthirius multifiliis]EGR31615.1 hypothetical protein IMG5_105970 [Ichthyophthirius multifiliis]|eukprot:XP_004035101.1 hypothetical protein IMG5_105970 [Ichthyophthirius multifiliis]
MPKNYIKPEQTMIQQINEKTYHMKQTKQYNKSIKSQPQKTNNKLFKNSTKTSFQHQNLRQAVSNLSIVSFHTQFAKFSIKPVILVNNFSKILSLSAKTLCRYVLNYKTSPLKMTDPSNMNSPIQIYKTQTKQEQCAIIFLQKMKTCHLYKKAVYQVKTQFFSQSTIFQNVTSLPYIKTLKF